MARDFEYELLEEYGIISQKGNISLEFKKIRWNGGEEKYDLRRWNDEKPLKGISLDASEMQALFIMLGTVLGVIDEEEQ